MVSSSKRIKQLYIALSILLLSFSAYVYLIGLFEWRDSLPPSLESAFPSGTMLIGVDATYPPFAVDNGQELYGIDIDLGNALAERMDIPVRFVNFGFDGLYDALIDGQVDVIISALLVNSSRTDDVRYTQPYFDNGLLLVTNQNDLQSMRDLPSHSLALEYGSNAHSEANFWMQRLEPFTIMPYELPQYALDAVRLNESDSALVDTTTYWLYLSEHSEWQSNAHRIDNAFYAIATRHDREETWVWVNSTLGQLKRDGTVQTIIDRGFSSP